MKRFRNRRRRLALGLPAAATIAAVAAIAAPVAPAAPESKGAHFQADDSKVPAGAEVKLSGRFAAKATPTDAPIGTTPPAPAPPATVRIQFKPTGKDNFHQVGVTGTDAKGRYAKTVNVKRSGLFRGIASDGRVSRPEYVRAKTRLRSRVAGKDVNLGDKIKVKGTVAPAIGRRSVIVTTAGDKTSVKTNSKGSFTAKLTPDDYGTQAVKVKARGDKIAAGSTDKAGKVTVYRPGEASWYGGSLYGNGMACGGTLHASTLGVAHKSLPCGTKVRIRYEGKEVAGPGRRSRPVRRRPRVGSHRGHEEQARLPGRRHGLDRQVGRPPRSAAQPSISCAGPAPGSSSPSRGSSAAGPASASGSFGSTAGVCSPEGCSRLETPTPSSRTGASRSNASNSSSAAAATRSGSSVWSASDAGPGEGAEGGEADLQRHRAPGDPLLGEALDHLAGPCPRSCRASAPRRSDRSRRCARGSPTCGPGRSRSRASRGPGRGGRGRRRGRGRASARAARVSAAASSATVVMPASSSRSSVFGPTPGMIRAGFVPDRRRGTSRGSTHMPSGLSRSEAIFAISRFGPEADRAGEPRALHDPPLELAGPGLRSGGVQRST